MAVNVFVGTGMSLREQVALFQTADAVVGLHGAGLVNIAFCRTGTVRYIE
jgi:capsular polysaccharide biosynthesis protein